MRPFERMRHLARMSGDDAETLLEEAADCLAGFADDPMGVVVACRRLLAYHPAVPQLWWMCAQILGAADPAEGAWSAWREWRQDTTPARLAGALPFPHESPVAVIGWPDVVRDGLAERVDLEILAVRNRYDDASLSRRLRVSVQSVRVVDETELGVLAPSHVLVVPDVVAGGSVYVTPGTDALVATARDAGAMVWLVVPRGVAVPARLFEAMEAATLSGPALDRADEWDDRDGSPTFTAWMGPAFDAVVGPDGLADPSTLTHRADCAAAPELLRLG